MGFPLDVLTCKKGSLAVVRIRVSLTLLCQKHATAIDVTLPSYHIISLFFHVLAPQSVSQITGGLSPLAVGVCCNRSCRPVYSEWADEFRRYSRNHQFGKCFARNRAEHDADAPVACCQRHVLPTRRWP